MGTLSSRDVRLCHWHSMGLGHNTSVLVLVSCWPNHLKTRPSRWATILEYGLLLNPQESAFSRTTTKPKVSRYNWHSIQYSTNIHYLPIYHFFYIWQTTSQGLCLNKGQAEPHHRYTQFPWQGWGWISLLEDIRGISFWMIIIIVNLNIST